MSLKNQAAKGLFWVAIERLGQQLLQTIIFIVLARLLTPEDFGLIAMLMIFFAIAQSLLDSGMGQALIREKEITDQDRSTVFWFNLFISIAFYGLLYTSAPFIAEFYERSELISLTRVMGLAVLFFGVAIVQRSELTQQLEFKKQAYAQIPAVVIAGVVSVTMAFKGFGVWALVAQYLLVAICSSIALWIVQPANIRLQFDKESFTKLFGFGYKLLLSGLLNAVYQHIYKLVIGKYFVATTLGFYTQAKKLQELVSQNFVGIIQKVTYPLLAKAGTEPARLKRGYRQVVQTSSFVIFPGIILLMMFAEPILRFVLGEKWVPATNFLQIVCLSGILHHLHSINLNVLKVLGRSDLFLKLEVIKKINITVAIFIGIRFGIYGLLIGQVISSYIALFINSWYTARFLDYSLLEQLEDVFYVLLLSSPMIVVLAISMVFIPVSSLWILIGYIILAALIYIVGNLLYRSQVVDTLLGMLHPYLPKKIKNFLSI